MKAIVLGTQVVDYVSRKTNQPVKGYTLSVAYKNSQVQGHEVSNVFISDNLGIPGIIGIRSGACVNIEYNNRGYVCGLEVITPSTPESAEAIRRALEIKPVQAPAGAASQPPAEASKAAVRK